MTAREWWSRLRGSLRRDDALEREMEAEMELHLEMATRRRIEAGLAPDAARRDALLAFGNREALKEEAREAHRARFAEGLISDMRFALRSMRRSPAFTVAAVLTLALGIGGTAAIFTVVNAVLLRPLPIPEPEDLRYVGWEWKKGNDIPALTDLQFEFARTNNRVFDAMMAYRTQEVHLGQDSSAQPIRGLRVTSGFFRTIGVTPRSGRAFAADEFEKDEPVVILSDHTWRTRLGADSGVLGRPIRLDGNLRTVVGVLPPEFQFPPAPDHAGYLVPLVVHADPASEGNNTEVIGRLRHGTSDVARDDDLRSLSSAFHAAHPSLANSGSFRLFTHQEVRVGNAEQRTLWLLLGAISLVLVIACANTATLLLVRASARQREIAVRASIGASPRHIIRQLLTEGLVLSAIASVVGIAISVLALRVFLTAAPGAIPAGVTPGIDATVLTFVIAISVVTGLVFGVAAGVPVYRARLQSLLMGGAHGASAGGMRLRNGLVFLQAAVAVVLLAGASLLAASFTRLIRVDPGFDVDRVVAVRLGRLPNDYDKARLDLLVDRVMERVRSLPGVENVAAAPNLPLERGMNFVVDTPDNPERGTGAVELRFVSPQYLATLGVPLRGGRQFGEGDVAGAEPVAIVNEAFARHFWKEQSPIGRTIRIGHFKDRWRIPEAGRHETRVIGVAADIHEIGLDRPAKATVLVPRAQHDPDKPVLLVRSASHELAAMVRSEIVAEEPRLAPVVEHLSTVVNRSVAGPRFRTMLVGAFAGFALVIAGVGIYGVIASSVQLRRREIALRLALGASRASVSAAVARRCLTSVASGVVAGLLGFWAVRRVLASWLFELSPGDPFLLALAVGVLAAVAGLASWIPTRQATRVDPGMALRLG